MIISEFLPNPVGKDAEGEWLELFNEGQGVINLNSWQLKDASGKTFTLDKFKISPGEYLVLDYKTTKISLNNNAETLFLYNQKGKLIDKAEFIGNAPEGKSLVRQNNQFVFCDKPTPGRANISELTEAGLEPRSSTYFDKSAVVTKGGFDFNNLFIGLAVSLVLAMLFTIIYKKINPSPD